jgi:hypothetical protein
MLAGADTLDKLQQQVTESYPSVDTSQPSAIPQNVPSFFPPNTGNPDTSGHLATFNGISLAQLHSSTGRAPPLVPRKAPMRWTAEEDQRLLTGIEAHGLNNWSLVASVVGGSRTKAQCAQRWSRGLDPKIAKSNWCCEEEQKLLDLVQVHGLKSWTKICQEMGNRSDVQCRFRYHFLCKKAEEAGGEVAPVSTLSYLTRELTLVNPGSPEDAK